jgi:phospholipid transport system substrate-binding protein
MSNITAITRRSALIAAFVLTFSGAMANAQGIAPESARNYIMAVGNNTVDVFNMTRQVPERRAGLTRVMLSCLDFDAIGTLVLGRMIRDASPDQRREVTPLLAAYVIDTAIEKFGDLQSVKFGVGNVTPQPNGDAKVYTRIHAGDRTMEVLWRVRNSPAGLKINDVELDGSSLVVHYRGEFERAGVTTVPQLIARLRELTRNSSSLPLTQQAMR